MAQSPRELNPPPRKSGRGLYFLGGCLLVLSAGAISALAFIRFTHTKHDRANLSQTQKAGKRVEIATVEKGPDTRVIQLLGESRPFYSVTLYARVSGYMTHLYTDIGATVKKDQLLAEVESPETQQAFLSAKADEFNKRRIATRARALLKRALISQQDADQAISNYDMAKANLETETTLQGYQKIVAPFDGVITDRFVDPGALIQNASGSPTAQPIFALTQSGRLRIMTYVNQADAPFIRVGDPARVIIGNNANDQLPASVTQIAGALDPKTRTLLAEMVMDNPDGKIVAGSFLHINVAVHSDPLEIAPSQALVMKGEQPGVEVVETNNTVKYRKIALKENDGKILQIADGLKVGEKVALNIGNSILDNSRIQPVEQKPNTKPSPAP